MPDLHSPITDDTQLIALFDQNASWFPDLLEPYVSRLTDAKDDRERRDIMRSALRETIRTRYPLPNEK